MKTAVLKKKGVRYAHGLYLKSAHYVKQLPFGSHSLRSFLMSVVPLRSLKKWCSFHSRIYFELKRRMAYIVKGVRSAYKLF